MRKFPDRVTAPRFELERVPEFFEDTYLKYTGATGGPHKLGSAMCAVVILGVDFHPNSSNTGTTSNSSSSAVGLPPSYYFEPLHK